MSSISKTTRFSLLLLKLPSAEVKSSSLDSFFDEYENFGDKLSVKPPVPPLVNDRFDSAFVDWYCELRPKYSLDGKSCIPPFLAPTSGDFITFVL